MIWSLWQFCNWYQLVTLSVTDSCVTERAADSTRVLCWLTKEAFYKLQHILWSGGIRSSLRTFYPYIFFCRFYFHGTLQFFFYLFLWRPFKPHKHWLFSVNKYIYISFCNIPFFWIIFSRFNFSSKIQRHRVVQLILQTLAVYECLVYWTCMTPSVETDFCVEHLKEIKCRHFFLLFSIPLRHNFFFFFRVGRGL